MSATNLLTVYQGPTCLDSNVINTVIIENLENTSCFPIDSIRFNQLVLNDTYDSITLVKSNVNSNKPVYQLTYHWNGNCDSNVDNLDKELFLSYYGRYPNFPLETGQCTNMIINGAHRSFKLGYSKPVNCEFKVNSNSSGCNTCSAKKEQCDFTTKPFSHQIKGSKRCPISVTQEPNEKGKKCPATVPVDCSVECTYIPPVIDPINCEFKVNSNASDCDTCSAKKEQCDFTTKPFNHQIKGTKECPVSVTQEPNEKGKKCPATAPAHCSVECKYVPPVIDPRNCEFTVNSNASDCDTCSAKKEQCDFMTKPFNHQIKGTKECPVSVTKEPNKKGKVCPGTATANCLVTCTYVDVTPTNTSDTTGNK
eukprot:Pgem_evm1s1318